MDRNASPACAGIGCRHGPESAQATIDVVFVGPAAGVGVPKIAVSESYGTISFDDHQPNITPTSFNGTAGDVSVGVGIGRLGPSYNRTRLGRAFSTGTGGTQTAGLNIGLGIVVGSSTVTSVEIENCSCAKK